MWEELEVRHGKRRDPNRWTISASASAVFLHIPRDHPIAADRVRVFFGKGEHAGWMLLRAADDGGGRVVNTAKGKSGARYLQFSTLPFLPPKTRFAERELLVKPDGTDMRAVRVRLPWVDESGRPVPKQVWDQAA